MLVFVLLLNMLPAGTFTVQAASTLTEGGLEITADDSSYKGFFNNGATAYGQPLQYSFTVTGSGTFSGAFELVLGGMRECFSCIIPPMALPATQTLLSPKSGFTK